MPIPSASTELLAAAFLRCQLEDKGGTGQPEQVDAAKFGAINSKTHIAGTGASCTLSDLQHPGIECPPAILFEAVRKQGGPEAVRRAQNFLRIANAPTSSVWPQSVKCLTAVPSFCGAVFGTSAV
jgi:hypothetical protein